MQSSKGRSLKALLTLSQKSQADDNPWGNPIDYRHLSDEQLEAEYKKSIAAIPVDVSEYETMDIGDLIRTYTELLG